MSTVLKYAAPEWDSHIGERGQAVSPGSVINFPQQNVKTGVFSRLRRWRERRRAFADLMALDDRLLRDIGISRGEIRAAIIGRR